MIAGTAAGTAQQGAAAVAWTRATHDDIERLEVRLSHDVLPVSTLAAARAEVIACAGRPVLAVPIDARRFVRAMARHLCFN